MNSYSAGKRVYGRLTNAEISTATVIPFADADGNAITFADGDRLIIYSLFVASRVTAGTVTVFQDHDSDNAYDAGEEIHTQFLDPGIPVFPMLYYPGGLPTRKINAAGTNDFMAVKNSLATGAVDIEILGDIIRA